MFRRVFAVSCLGPGPLCQSLFPHQTRTPADDPRCHSLSTGVEGGHVSPFTVCDSRSLYNAQHVSVLAVDVLSADALLGFTDGRIFSASRSVC